MPRSSLQLCSSFVSNLIRLSDEKRYMSFENVETISNISLRREKVNLWGRGCVKEQCEKCLEEEWKQIGADYLKNLISTMPKGLHRVIKHVEYLIQFQTFMNNHY